MTREPDHRRHSAPPHSTASPASRHAKGAASTVAGRLSVRTLAAEGHELVTVLSARGDIDLATAPVLRKALRSVVDQRAGAIVVDLSAVAFMDSTGVHVLADTLQRLEAENRALAVVCGESGQVNRVLDLVGLLDALAVYRSRESAVIAVGARPSPSQDSTARSTPGMAPVPTPTKLAPATPQVGVP